MRKIMPRQFEMTKTEEKKFCSHCGDRVSHSARRCPYCHQRIFSARLVLPYILAVVTIAAILLVLYYLKTSY